MAQVLFAHRSQPNHVDAALTRNDTKEHPLTILREFVTPNADASSILAIFASSRNIVARSKEAPSVQDSSNSQSRIAQILCAPALLLMMCLLWSAPGTAKAANAILIDHVQTSKMTPFIDDATQRGNIFETSYHNGNFFNPYANVQSATAAPLLSFSMWINCNGTSQACGVAYQDGFSLANAAKETFYITGSNNLCSDIDFAIYIDGKFVAKTSFIGPDQLTPTYQTPKLSAGGHVLDVFATGRLGGCNAGILNSWSSTLTMH